MILNFCIALMNCGTTNSMHITRTRPGLSRVYPQSCHRRSILCVHVHQAIAFRIKPSWYISR
jgi:hypothetical protein